ncbi:glycine--tRNA ligase subunit beta [Tahibacter amnicola]|uniref:Glycine--tRNA ligase beta subunit n=1 Tax=Tahibacter amnicola TaxID=2976241 RepID=A0ABY6BF04_9GAMM|nr:glycine--tRNA ligase subunit beta [Tahibacter amnicola]UXI68614.1 glycine--tRNA ligase subunit beta [Tahibacter amnicola]
MLDSLLIEIGTEELPTRTVDELAQAFAGGIIEGLKKRGFAVDGEAAKVYCSPRRLALWLAGVADAQPDQAIERRGPAIAAALDASGQPTKALSGFAASCGTTVEALQRLETDKGAWFVYRAEQPGQPLAALLPDVIGESLKALPVPKPMRWGDHDYAFVRPMHWLVILHGSRVIDAEIFGIASGRASRGHRFHHSGPVAVDSADAWLDALRGARVLADPAERRQRIRDEVERAGREIGATPRLRPELLDEIANLTEWPVAIRCTFERDFLRVPQEALIMTMETNQKFVPVFDAAGKLTEHFIGIANIESADPAEIRKGYERVIRPRFADARFFYDEDLKAPLESHQPTLANVTYQQALGSVWDKTIRVAELARTIANRVGVDAALATRAAGLAKCDLMTRMVGEFPELQGTMGRYYATAGNEPAEVAEALDTFYQPRFAGDGIAPGRVGQVLAVAERVDTLCGIFAVGQKPSGNKDPFALRRAALGLARTLIESGLSLDLPALLADALGQIPESALAAGMPKPKEGAPAFDAGQRRAELGRELYDFVLDRLRGYYTDLGIAPDLFEAVRALAPGDLSDFDARLRAVGEFARLPEAAALAAANKRIGNILRQAGQVEFGQIQTNLLGTGAESGLHDALVNAQAATAPLIADRTYVAVLKRLAELRDPVDAFFNDVMVMADDAAVRQNRLTLLAQLRQLFLHVADISVLQAA